MSATNDMGFRDALSALSSAQKSNKGAPAYSRFVNRPLGRVFAAAAFLIGLTPNTVTVISGLVTFSGIVCLALLSPSLWLGLLVGVLLIVGYALDSADGQLARLRGGGSLAGEWLDHMVDCMKLSSLHTAVAIHVYRYWDVEPRWVLLPAAFVIVANTLFFAHILNEQLIHKFDTGRRSGGTDSPASVLVAVLKAPTDYGLLCVAFLFLGVRGVFVALYSLIFVGSLGYLSLGLFKWYGDMKRLDSLRRAVDVP